MKSLNNILYVSDIDDEGNLCFAFNEDKTQKKKYVCPNCGVPMILKKSDKEGKYTKRPHFAHKSNENHDCCPETVLHNTFKNELYRILKERLENNMSFIFKWKCKSCVDTHSGDLLKCVHNIYLEKDLDVCRPDILLTDKNDKPIFAVEVVVTHKPEEKTLQYYKDNKIWLYQIDLKSDEDLKDIENKAKYPFPFDVCRRPKCKTCDTILTRRTIYVKEGKCKNCDGIINMTMGEGDEGIFLPVDYKQEEIDFAKSKNVLFKNYNCEHLKQNSIYSVCPHCNTNVVDYYSDQQMAIIGEKNFYYCKKCEYKITHPFEGKKCDKCGRSLTTRTVSIYLKKCKNCKTLIIVAEADYEIKPYMFTKEQIEFSNQNGANIQQIQSSIFKKSFYDNVCTNCGCFGNDGHDGQLLTFKYFPHCNRCEPYWEPRICTPREVCSVCGGLKVKRTLYVVETYCYRCNKPMKLAFIAEPNGVFSFNFNSWHKSKAANYGVVFQDNKDYPIVCPTCNAPFSSSYASFYITCKEIWHDNSNFYCPQCYRQRQIQNSIN